jgi:hypothetical protein
MRHRRRGIDVFVDEFAIEMVNRCKRIFVTASGLFYEASHPN